MQVRCRFSCVIVCLYLIHRPEHVEVILWLNPVGFLQVIGTISGTGKIVLKDKNQAPTDPTPVDLDLEKVLGDMPRKTYSFNRRPAQLEALDLPEGTKPGDALRQVLKLPSVHSKRFLTTKVDRCVTGLTCLPPVRADLTLLVVYMYFMAPTRLVLICGSSAAPFASSGLRLTGLHVCLNAAACKHAAAF